ncbi:MAG: NAD(+)--dinitrogen-reductase ADP-D-ribosyltransferase [Opitutaceae bacterium]
MPKLPAAPPTIFNRCNLSPWVIGDREFQDHPQPLDILGVRQADRRLFQRLATIADPEQRGQVFHDYVSVKFQLHEWAEHRNSARSSIRSSYIQFLRHWGVDSNGHAGAVLKSWVESRFGLPPTFHGGRIEADNDARHRYECDRLRGAAKTVGALMQLDLLYTFCQDELPRRFPGEHWRTLYRGTHDPEEYAIRNAVTPEPKTTCVQLNNLSSFTADREIAWEFGSSVWEVPVPVQKIVFFSGLLPRHLLEGESEYLVLGGEYRMKPLLY